MTMTLSHHILNYIKMVIPGDCFFCFVVAVSPVSLSVLWKSFWRFFTTHFRFCFAGDLMLEMAFQFFSFEDKCWMETKIGMGLELSMLFFSLLPSLFSHFRRNSFWHLNKYSDYIEKSHGIADELNSTESQIYSLIRRKECNHSIPNDIAK